MGDIGSSIYKLAQELWPLNRSVTGEGARATLLKIQEIVPSLKIFEVSSGTKVFDWTVPDEWYIHDAYIVKPCGKKICHFKNNNLHVVGYSSPVNKKISLEELQEHLHSLPDQPTAIPYVTSYYQERWGFCISHEDRQLLEDGEYHVVVKSRLFKGVLNYGELLIKGQSDKEIFLSSYICHPSMANNELSGPTVLAYLSKWLLSLKTHRYSYRIILVPETIGSIAYLSKNYVQMKKNVVAGFNISCVGDDRAYSYVPSRQGDTLSDCVAQHVLKWTDPHYCHYSWSDRGSDERQYCSPGIDLPIASICRSKYGSYPEYHTSLDVLGNVVTSEGLQGGYNVLRRSIEILENNRIPRMTVLCEPQLGKRGLYPDLSIKGSADKVQLMMDFISWCDGTKTLLEISEILNVPVWELYGLSSSLQDEKLIVNSDMD